MAEERIRTRHPLRKSGRNIEGRKYETVRRALLAALKKRALTHDELMHALRHRLEGRLEGSVGWYGETVKLDLEARGIVERIGTRPQKYRLA